MLTPDHPLLHIWRSQPANRHITDAYLRDAITAAYERVDAIANRKMTPGARDTAASYVVRIAIGHHDEKDTLREIFRMLTGADV